MKIRISYILSLMSMLIALAACSTVSSLEDGEQLYTGLEPISWQEAKGGEHLTITKEEVEAALATAPNGAFFGSSYYRTPFPYGLWIWNWADGSDSPVKRWMKSSFGMPPVLISNVNPELRTSVAKSVLENNGYFRGDISYKIIDGKPQSIKSDTTKIPRTAKIKYSVEFGHLFTLDTVFYSNFPAEAYDIISTKQTLLHPGDAFSITALDNERTRIYNELRNRGYYFYKPSYTTFLADTLNSPGKVKMQLHLLDSLPDEAMRRWVIGRTSMEVKRNALETLTDTIQRRFLTVRYGGKKPPLRPRVILSDMKLRPGQIFSQDAYEESLNNLTAKGIFSTMDITFTPRYNEDGTLKTVPDSVASLDGNSRVGAGVLDMKVSTTLEKPYDFTFEADVTESSNGRGGPGISVSLDRRNAFRGGELFSINAGADYVFQLSRGTNMGHSYDFNLGTSLMLPRLLLPNWFKKDGRRRRWFTTPATMMSVSGNLQRRSGFYDRAILAAEYQYIMQPSATTIHKFSPLSLTYANTSNITDEYWMKVLNSAVSLAATNDEFIPRMRYTYTYTSPVKYRNPVFLEITATEAGNITNLLSMAINGKAWSERGGKVMGAPFGQFLKLETNWRKTWLLGDKSSVVAHFFAGLMTAYGNNNMAPFTEHFYIGGANDMRGFSMRSIGPGQACFDDYNSAYLYNIGDTKAVLNLEYRPHLFGSLYGALFMDVGGIWYLQKKMREFYREYNMGDSAAKNCAIDVGVGIRYDLDFFVLRLDWGFAVHNPAWNAPSGFFNPGKLKDAQCINFAIGYPF